MSQEFQTVDEYIQSLPEDRKEAIKKIRTIIQQNLPRGFVECISYGMIGYVVPHSLYPDGYHCNPKLPLPFLNLASQKNYIALYHCGIYADDDLLAWFQKEYAAHSSKKLDMGKSCIRFKKIEDIPYKLIGQLVSKMTVEEWIALYEKNVKKK